MCFFTLISFLCVSGAFNNLILLMTGHTRSQEFYDIRYTIPSEGTYSYSSMEDDAGLVKSLVFTVKKSEETEKQTNVLITFEQQNGKHFYYDINFSIQFIGEPELRHIDILPIRVYCVENCRKNVWRTSFENYVFSFNYLNPKKYKESSFDFVDCTKQLQNELDIKQRIILSYQPFE